MIRRTAKGLLLATLCSVFLLACGNQDAHALFGLFRRWHSGGGWASGGSWGGSWGSRGGWSSGGSWGSWGGASYRRTSSWSSYGGAGWGSWGSTGGWSGWGGSGGYAASSYVSPSYSYGSSPSYSYGSSPSYSYPSNTYPSYGSSPYIEQSPTYSYPTEGVEIPGSQYSTPGVPTEAAPNEGTPQPALPQGPEKSTGPGARSDSASLTVYVPAEARVFVNGSTTRSEGPLREYVSHKLRPGRVYTFKVRAEVTRDGRSVDETKFVRLVAGRRQVLRFDLAETASRKAKTVETKLAVRLPKEAVVFLSGKRSRSTGPLREFTTTRLAEGEAWHNYTIRATLQRGGRTMVRERRITLRGGESRELAIDFDEAKLAGSVATSAR